MLARSPITTGAAGDPSVMVHNFGPPVMLIRSLTSTRTEPGAAGPMVTLAVGGSRRAERKKSRHHRSAGLNSADFCVGNDARCWTFVGEVYRTNEWSFWPGGGRRCRRAEAPRAVSPGAGPRASARLRARPC